VSASGAWEAVEAAERVNMFAWNSMTETQIRKFNATKCIFASLCVEDGDLDYAAHLRQCLQGPEGTVPGDIEGWRGRCACVQAYEEQREQVRKGTLSRRAGVLELVHHRYWIHEVATRWSGIQLQNGGWLAVREAFVGADGAARIP